MSAEAALERLRASRRPRVLFVSHGFGGGVARHIAELAAAVEADAEVLLLEPALESHVALGLPRGDGATTTLWLHAAREWPALVALLRAVRVDLVHYHHVHGLPHAVLSLPRELAALHRVTLHDYFAACPAYHLTGGDGRFCGGEPDCRRCLESGPAQWPLGIDAWRAEFGALLRSAERVIAPSRDAAERIARFFPGVSPVVWPHLERGAMRAAAPMRVLVPGAISPAKGVDVLAACVRDAAARRLPLHFRIVGYVSRPIGEWPDLPASLAGEYREPDLDALIALERADAFFFPAQCPETFSYTLSAALRTGLPIVATNLGAFPERLAGRNARLVAWDTPPAGMNDALLSFHASRPPAPPPAGRDDGAAYRDLYLAGIASGAPPQAPLPSIAAAWREPPVASPHLSTLAWLLGDAVDCGRRRSLEELRRRVPQADARLAEAESERAALESLRSELARANAALEDARLQSRRAGDDARAAEARIRKLESSRSWRLTAPLRALTRLLRRG
jgi:glycosyltransferase involved in cell wall biosynthesis